jgi:DNA-binding beta-propeller fold protein YncE
MRRTALVTLCCSLALVVVPCSPAFGDDPGGGPVTPAGWRVAPAGAEIGVPRTASGFQGPLGSALSPDGQRLLTSSSGAARIDSVDLFDLRNGRRADFVPYDAVRGESAFLGIVYSPDGRRAWASGGGQNVVHVYDVRHGGLRETGQISTPFFPAGLAYGHTPRGDRIYVANNLSAPATGSTGNPAGHQVTVIDPSTDTVVGTTDLGAPLAPLGVAFSSDGRHAFVTNWLGRSVSVIDTASERKTGDVELSPASNPLAADHPGAVAANQRRPEIYTANANSDTVSVLDAHDGRLLDTIDIALVRGGPKGANPDGLDVSPDGRWLYVAEAGENAVAVVDLQRRATVGFLPASWYPADVKATPDGRRIVVTNTNDSGAGPNPCGPLTPHANCPPKDPNRDDPSRDSTDPQYSGSMIKGSVQVIDLPRHRGQLDEQTRQVRRNNQVHARERRRPAGAASIKHVIYVLKENRTFDQVFGDLGRGNGDPSLALFRDNAAPNHRELARRFSVIDNFYADAEVSADGHNWATQANATDYVDRTWPINYSPNPRSSQRSYDFEDLPFSQQFPSEPLASDPTIPRSPAAQTVGYLWDNAYAHGVSYRDYGEYTQFPGDCSGSNRNISHTTHLDEARFPGHVDTAYAGYGLSCSDHAQREPEWEREFHRYETTGALPALSIVRLPNDHTRGTTPGAATPSSYVADNDLALGRLVAAVSHSRYWKDTLIVVTEDDAQNGPDHVDAHRTVALAISPYTQTGGVDHTHYDTASMVATTEDLLGLPPMSIVDARVNRMWGSFTDRPNYAAYDAKAPSVTPYGDPGAPTNTASAPMAAAAARWNFGREDQAPEIALNRAIWKSVRGRRSAMPSPRHVRIVGSRPNDEGAGPH